MRAWLAAAVALLALAGAQAALVLTAAPMEPLRVEPLLPDAARAPTDEDLDVARRFAPWIYHETHARWGRQDIPAAMDFDGDMDGANAWENLPRHELVPTVYYTLAETETHLFLTYHVYHPRDWAPLMLGIHDTHEGDGESVQVVVDKATDEIVLLTTQAHFRAASYAPHPGPIRSGAQTLRSDLELRVGHPVVLVETGGHAIHSVRDARAATRFAHPADPLLSYRPAEPGEEAREPQPPYEGEHAYRLVSLGAFLANRTDGTDLFAGTVEYEGHPVPRYHRGDRYSGPLGPSRGMSPFSLGYSFDRGEVGALFWDPAGTYASALTIDGAWSTEYVRHAWRGVG